MMTNLQSLFFIFFIFSIVILLNVLYIKTTDLNIDFNNNDLINNIMGSILILFGSLKLYDLNKFSKIFIKYNIISKNFSIYSYIYPFIEIILGIFLFLKYNLQIVYILILILMIINLISVLFTIYLGQNLRCGCLGSFFHLPLSYVTISENIIMLFMIIYNILYK